MKGIWNATEPQRDHQTNMTSPALSIKHIIKRSWFMQTNRKQICSDEWWLIDWVQSDLKWYCVRTACPSMPNKLGNYLNKYWYWNWNDFNLDNNYLFGNSSLTVSEYITNSAITTTCCTQRVVNWYYECDVIVGIKYVFKLQAERKTVSVVMFRLSQRSKSDDSFNDAFQARTLLMPHVLF